MPRGTSSRLGLISWDVVGLQGENIPYRLKIHDGFINGCAGQRDQTYF